MTSRRWASGLVLALAVLWSCLDGTGPEAQRALLEIHPVFLGMGTRAGGTSDVDSFVIRIVNPPLADQVIVRRIPPGQDTIQIAVAVDLTAAVDTVNVSFEGYSSVTGLLLYAGTQSVVATAGVPTTVPVTATYVGPGQGIDSLTVVPNAVSLAPGTSATITVTGFDANAPMAPESVPVFFTSADPAIARVDSGGTITAVALGNTRVFATSVARSAVEDTTDVTVTTVPNPAIGLSTTSVSFADTVATASPTARTVSVANTGGSTLSGLAVGTITYGAGASGWLTATVSPATAPATLTLTPSNAGLTAGTYTATVPVTASNATNSPQNVTVSYTLAPALPVSIALTPGFGVVRPTLTLPLAVSAKDINGNPTPAGTVTYLSRSTGVATVNATTGVVTGVAGGTATIVATSAVGPQDSISVAVAANGSAVLSAIADSRAFDAVRPGDTVRVLVEVNLSGVAPEKLGSYNDSLGWDPAILRYVSHATVAGGFAAPTVNAAGVTSGILRFGAADAAGSAGPAVGLIRITFVAQAVGTTTLAQTPSDLSAAGTFLQMLPQALVAGSQVKVQ